MFDKNAQRQRAAQFAGASGEKAVSHTVPVKPVNVFKDKLGNVLNVGDRVARAYESRLLIQTVTKIDARGVWLDNSNQPIVYLTRLVKM